MQLYSFILNYNLFNFFLGNNRVEKIYEAYPCTYFRTKFEHGDFSFGEKENTTFLVYVYGFHTPFWLQVGLK